MARCDAEALKNGRAQPLAAIAFDAAVDRNTDFVSVKILSGFLLLFSGFVE